jgi:hypothetical protein
MLAEAISLGTKLSALNYDGRIHDPEATGVRASLERLRTSTGAFLDAAALDRVNVDEVFPLYEEIQRRATMRRER